MPAQHCHVDLPDDDLRYLQCCARIRHLSTVGLIKRLVRIIAHDQLVLSILDDGSQPVQPEPQARYRRSKLFQDC